MPRSATRVPPRLAFVALLALAFIACGDDAEEAAPAVTDTVAASPRTDPPLSGRISVFAASSLTESFKAAGEAFKQAHPGVTVEFNFQSSSNLAAQIEQAAPADVFASADSVQMQRVVDQQLVAEAPVVFAKNLPVIVIPADNRAGVTSAKDLSKAGLKLVLAGPQVPIGNYARQIIDRLAADPANGAGFKDAALKNLVSNEANVRAVLTKVELGEADAAIVYRTDALISGNKVKTVAIPDSANVIATYPIAVVKSSKTPRTAAAFISFIRSAEGQAILATAGFDKP